MSWLFRVPCVFIATYLPLLSMGTCLCYPWAQNPVFPVCTVCHAGVKERCIESCFDYPTLAISRNEMTRENAGD